MKQLKSTDIYDPNEVYQYKPNRIIEWYASDEIE